MASIKELPLWARILLGEETVCLQDRRSPDRENIISGEAADILVGCNDSFLSEGQPARTLNPQSRWTASVSTLCGEA